MTITFIGGGNMATALVGGMLTHGAAAADFRIVEPSGEARERLATRHPGIARHGGCTREAVAGATLVRVGTAIFGRREAAP